MGHISRLVLENFTAFAQFDQEFCEGVNVFIGENGTGKTHVLKVLYSSPDLFVFSDHITPNLLNFSKLFPTVRPENFRRHFSCDSESRTKIGIQWIDFLENITEAEIFYKGLITTPSLKELHLHNNIPDSGRYNFIPTKEILVNSPGFISLYANREISFDLTYPDILQRANLPKLREIPSQQRELMDRIKSVIGGDVIQRGEKFFIATSFGELDFNLVAEGHRKLALLWLLLQNGSLAPGSILFWDEPEANLNPKLMRTLVEILLELQRQGVQIFLATHHYDVLRWLDLLKTDADKLRFFSLYNETGKDGVQVSVSDDYAGIQHDPTAQAGDALYDAVIEHELRRSQP